MSSLERRLGTHHYTEYDPERFRYGKKIAQEFEIEYDELSKDRRYKYRDPEKFDLFLRTAEVKKLKGSSRLNKFSGVIRGATAGVVEFYAYDELFNESDPGWAAFYGVVGLGLIVRSVFDLRKGHKNAKEAKRLESTL